MLISIYVHNLTNLGQNSIIIKHITIGTTSMCCVMMTLKADIHWSHNKVGFCFDLHRLFPSSCTLEESGTVPQVSIHCVGFSGECVSCCEVSVSGEGVSEQAQKRFEIEFTDIMKTAVQYSHRGHLGVRFKIK